MAEEWEYFPCSMGANRAFIFVNVAMKETIDRAPTTLCKVRLKYRHTHSNGLPADQDFEAANQIEDRLCAFAADAQDSYAGRVTVAGHRYFYFYTTQSESAWKKLAKTLSSEFRFRLEVSHRDDPSRSGYYNELYPTPDDWCVIRDLKVIEAAEEQGDDGSQARRIDHFCYFDRPHSARRLLVWALKNGFEHDAKLSGRGDDGRYCVRLHHLSTLEISDISHYTISLRRKCEDFGGEYDGWETEVVAQGTIDRDATIASSRLVASKAG